MNTYNNAEIRRLLDRYYEGDTTESEENLLRDYFAQSEVDPDLEDDRLLFEAMTGDACKAPELPAGLERLLSDSIDSWQRSECRQAPPRRVLRFIPWRRPVSIAASVAVLLGLGIMFIHIHSHGDNSVPTDTFTDPQEAYAETQRVFLIFSNTIDKSMQQLEKMERSQDKALRYTLEQLDKI